MSDNKKPEQMKPFKSRKEVALLVVAALVFAVVIYTMYFKGDAETFETAEPVEENVVEAASPSVVLAKVAMCLQQTAIPEPPGAPARDPFAPSDAFRAAVFRDTAVQQGSQKELEPVVLTGSNTKSVLMKIPGAEVAAAAGLQLDAVMSAGEWHGAVINGKVIAKGEQTLGFTLVEVGDDKVMLRCGVHRVVLLVRPQEAGTEEQK